MKKEQILYRDFIIEPVEDRFLVYNLKEKEVLDQIYPTYVASSEDEAKEVIDKIILSNNQVHLGQI